MKLCTFDPRFLGYESLSLKPRTSDLQTGFVEPSISRDLIFGLSFHLERKNFWSRNSVCVTIHCPVLQAWFCQFWLNPWPRWLLILFSKQWIGLGKFKSVSNGYFVELKYESLGAVCLCVVLVGFLKKNQGCHYKNMKARGTAWPVKELKIWFLI